MIVLMWLVLAIGVAPLVLGLARLPRGTGRVRLDLPSLLLCALAFNLTFFWQELWLVVPKAMAGLDPVLFHNNHDWRGEAPIAELLQGTGALGTLDSGIAFAMALALGKQVAATWRLFFFWMAFQGLFQALSQLAIGTLLPGNDVGRALAYLQIGGPAKIALLLLAAACMAFAGRWLARRAPFGGEADRALGYGLLATALIAVVLIIPFRLPRHIIEVALIPLIVNLIGVAWLILGASLSKAVGPAPSVKPGLLGPALGLAATLAVFQFVLRPGIAF